VTGKYLPATCPPSTGGGVVYDEMKRHEIEVLRQVGGFSLREVARRADVSLDTVMRILDGKDSVGAPARRVGRPAVAAAFEPHARKILEERPDLPTVEVLRLLREQGYTGSKTPCYQLVRALRKVAVPPLVRFEGLCGEFSQNDFGEVRVRCDDGTEEKLHFFASRLKWSRWVYVELTPNQKVESLVRALLNSFESFGGIPLLCVFDNPKTIVTARHGNVIEWNPTFAQVATDYRIGMEMCTPRRGQEKGSVESLVGFTKNGFFRVRRFHDRADLEAQFADWQRVVNHERPCRATNVIPAHRIGEERKRLRPLPIPAAEYALRYPVRVGPTGFVSFQGILYSMPAETMGFNATLFLYREQVRIVAGDHEVAHPRFPHNGISSEPKHMTAALARVAGKRGRVYYQRERLLEVGPPAETFLTELVHGHPHSWQGDVEHLFELLLQHGPERLSLAFQEATGRGWYGSDAIDQWLRREGTP